MTPSDENSVWVGGGERGSGERGEKAKNFPFTNFTREMVSEIPEFCFVQSTPLVEVRIVPCKPPATNMPLPKTMEIGAPLFAGRDASPQLSTGSPARAGEIKRKDETIRAANLAIGILLLRCKYSQAFRNKSTDYHSSSRLLKRSNIGSMPESAQATPARTKSRDKTP